MDELLSLKQKIKQTESEIKDLQSQLMIKKSANYRRKQAEIRKAKYPENDTRITKVKHNDFRGIAEEHIELLRNLESEISGKEKRLMEIVMRSQEISHEIDEQAREIEQKEHKIQELRSRIFDSEQQKQRTRANYELTHQKVNEKRIEIKSLKRLSKDAELAVTSVIQRKEQPLHDRMDLKPMMKKLLELDNKIRYVQSQNSDFEEQIRLYETEIAVPITYTEEEKESLYALENADSESLHSDNAAMMEAIKQKEKEARSLQRKVNVLHASNNKTEETYKLLLSISRESIDMTESTPEESTEQLIQRLHRTVSEMKSCEDVANQMLKEKVTENGDLEGRIKRKLMEIEHSRIRLEQERSVLNLKIRAARDDATAREVKIVNKIQNLEKKMRK